MKAYQRIVSRTLTLWISMNILLFAGFAQGAETIKTVDVMGTGQIVRDNDSEAREQAISDGLVTAVGLVVMESLSPESVVLNFESLNAMLYTHTESFVQNYKVMTEMRFRNYYRVMVRATISVQAVQRQLSDLGIFFDKTSKAIPKVLIILAEQRIEDISPQYFWGKDFVDIKKASEIALSETLARKGFFVINHNKKIAAQAMNPPVLSIDMDENTIFKLGEQFQADMVLVGVASATKTQNKLGSELQSFKGQISVSVYKMASRSEIASVSKASVTAHSDEFIGGNLALTDVGNLAGEELAPQLKTEWLKNDQKKSEIEIIINGTRNLANFVKFRRNLKAIKGVKDVLTKEMKYNVTVIRVNYQGTAKELADNLLLRAIEGFGIEISEVTEASISLNLIAN